MLHYSADFPVTLHVEIVALLVDLYQSLHIDRVENKIVKIAFVAVLWWMFILMFFFCFFSILICGKRARSLQMR